MLLLSTVKFRCEIGEADNGEVHRRLMLISSSDLQIMLTNKTAILNYMYIFQVNNVQVEPRSFCDPVSPSE